MASNYRREACERPEAALRGALLQLGLGLSISIPVALACGRLLAIQLYGGKSHDRVILGLAAAVLAACARWRDLSVRAARLRLIPCGRCAPSA